MQSSRLIFSSQLAGNIKTTLPMISLAEHGKALSPLAYYYSLTVPFSLSFTFRFGFHITSLLYVRFYSYQAA